MERFIHNETNGLDYELVVDYYMPILKVLEKCLKSEDFGKCDLIIYETTKILL